MRDEDIREIAERAGKATEGPWIPDCPFGDWNFPLGYNILVGDGTEESQVTPVAQCFNGGEYLCFNNDNNRRIVERDAKNAAFIAASRADVPALCAEALARGERLREAEGILGEIALQTMSLGRLDDVILAFLAKKGA